MAHSPQHLPQQPQPRFWNRLRASIARTGTALRPSPRAWHGATVAVLLAALALWLWDILPEIDAALLTPLLLIAGTNLLLVPLLALLLLALLGLFLKLPRAYRWALCTAVVLLVTAGAGASQRGWWLVIALVVLAVGVVGGVGWSMVRGGWRGAGWGSRLVNALALALALAVLVGGGRVLLGAGTPAAPVVDVATLGAEVAASDQPDPSLPGTYAVQTLTYGSGRDARRLEYGDEADIVTEPVDGSRIVGGWTGWTGAARTRYWGFDSRALPLNGRVWYPEGAGPFPLVLIVHGNTRATDPSDTGFAYLGELLASHGYIAVSVDQNFLNTGMLDSAGGLTGANPARGWLLLEHLRVWHAWNTASDSPFFGRIDTDNIALVGHSRGGEAVAIAAMFNRLQSYPDDPTLVFDYDYEIRSVIALAPSEGQYLPAGGKVTLQNVNYLALQGSHDADVVAFAALNQYHRIGWTGDQPWLKAAIYIHRANHSQFNTAWDRYDVGEGASARLINTAALLPPADQRKIAQVYVTAFLEATLHEDDAYRAFFRDTRAGRGWLPPAVSISQYALASTRWISTSEEDLDPTTATLGGATQTAEGLAEWTEEFLPLRRGVGDNRVVRLRWARGSDAQPRYTITLPAGALVPTPHTLRWSMADVGAPAGTPIDVAVEVADADGDLARLPLSHVMPLQPPISGQYLKSAVLHDAPTSDPVLQTYSFPLADFAATNAAFDPAALASVAFVFDPTTAETILVDDVGLD